MEANENTVLNNTENNLSKKKDNKVLMGGIIAAVILVLAAAIGFGIYNSPSNRLSRQLDLGQKYLEEMDYEQAKVAFEEVIAIDPSNAEAYLGAARAYAGLEDYEGAVAILQKGYEQTGDESLKAQLEEYEEKLEEEARRMEEEKQEAAQRLEQEIEEYLQTVPMISGVFRDNPIYTYSYMKRIYSEKVSQLSEYVEMDISDTMRLRILYAIHDCCLAINDMEKAKEYWAKCVALSDMLGSDSEEKYDEYGRLISCSNKEGTTIYEYYENSSLAKVKIETYPCTVSGEYSDVFQTEYEKYDDEGRILEYFYHGSCGYEVANASSFPADYPIENRSIDERIYTYEENSRKTLGHTVTANVYGGETHFLTARWESKHTYDETGKVISWEVYDEDGSLLEEEKYEEGVAYTGPSFW